MQVKLRYAAVGNSSEFEEEFETERLLAASEAFHYWTFWYPEDADGKTRVRFIKDSELLELNLVGEDEEEPKLASVTPLRGGE